MDENNSITPSGSPKPTWTLAGGSVIEPSAHLFDSRPRQDNGGAADGVEDDSVRLFEYWRLIRRRQGILILAMCLGVVGAVLVTLPQTPVYQAKTSLELLDLNQNFMNMKDVDQVADESGYNLLTDIQTQIKILQSDMLVDKVVHEMSVGQPDQPADMGVPAWRKLLRLPASVSQGAQQKALGMARRELKVRAAGQTRIIEVMVDATNPKIAAEFANRLAQDYIEGNIQSRWEMTQKTGDFLATQLDDMRAKLERSEDQMQEYARQQGLFFTDEKTNVTEERLKDLQDELTRAQADRVMKQSHWEMAKSASPQTLPDVLNDPTLRQYEQKLADLQRDKADLENAFNPEYPKVKRIAAQMTAVDLSMRLKQDDILKQIKNDYDSAMRREVLLQGDYRAQTTIVSDQAEKAIQYNILKREVDTNRQLYESMLQHVKEASIASALRASNIRVVDPAKVPASPYKPEIWLNALLGLLAGTFFGMTYIVMTEKADRMLQDPSDIGLYLGAPELGVIPSQSSLKDGNKKQLYALTKDHMATGNASGELKVFATLRETPELVTWQQKRSLMAESFRAALTSILFTSQTGPKPKIVVITSPNPGDGKTTVATNLAIALAETGQRVLLIDADLRKPRLHTIFNLDNTKGMSSLLRSGHLRPAEDLGKALKDCYYETAIPGLFVVPAGPNVAGPTNLLYAKHFPEILHSLLQSFDMILLDTPPMLAIADARLIGKLASGVLLVVRAGSTTRDAAVAARLRLREDGIRMIGTIMNDWNPKYSRSGYYGYYDNYNRYYQKYSFEGSEQKAAGD
jgi:capsular exopolysaccharide synthesis family protein